MARPKVSPGRESESSCSMDIGVKVNSMQAFVLARNRYSSGSQLYFVRWGSESVTDDAVQSGRVHRIYNGGNMYAPFLCLRISYRPNLFLQACEMGTVCIALCVSLLIDSYIIFIYDEDR